MEAATSTCERHILAHISILLLEDVELCLDLLLGDLMPRFDFKISV